jgi:hypothetical protein
LVLCESRRALPEMPTIRRLEVEVPAGGAEGVGGRGDPAAGGGDGLCDALDRQLAGDGRGAVLAQLDARGGEADRRVVGGVEELLAEDVRTERLSSG